MQVQYGLCSDIRDLMTTQSTTSSSVTLWLCAVYFFSCGISAIAAPQLWLLCAGLSAPLTPELEIVFGVAGVYLLALGYGAARAARAIPNNLGIIAVLIAANLFDFLVTLKEVVVGRLPLPQGGAFLAITLVWITLLWKIFSAHHHHTEEAR
jgi:hypothetical protein